MAIIDGTLSSVPFKTHSVAYTCTFNNNWSEENHPIEYPDNAHWSPPVIVAHNDEFELWELNEKASDGVEEVAETGATGDIRDEISDAQDDQEAGDFVQGSVTFNNRVQEQTFDPITVTPWYFKMSSITMIAPSPDWFTGFSGIEPSDTNNKGEMVWFESFEIETAPYDAGTEEGDEYDGDNSAEDPQDVIRKFTTSNVPDSEVFLSKDKSTILPVASWTCEMTSSECVDTKERPDGEECDADRCDESFNGVKLSSWCPKTCGVCGTRKPTKKPTRKPTRRATPKTSTFKPSTFKPTTARPTTATTRDRNLRARV